MDNNADHEERISKNTDRIDSVKAEMDFQILEIGNKMEEQEGRTASMIGGIFSKLSGVLAREVSESVRAVEAREAEQDGEMAMCGEKNVQQDEKIRGLEDALADFKREVIVTIAEQNTKIEEQENRILSQDKTIALQENKIKQQDKKIEAQNKTIFNQHATISFLNDKILKQEEKVGALCVRVRDQADIIAKHSEQILEHDGKISKQYEMIQELKVAVLQPVAAFLSSNLHKKGFGAGKCIDGVTGGSANKQMCHTKGDSSDLSKNSKI